MKPRRRARIAKREGNVRTIALRKGAADVRDVMHRAPLDGRFVALLHRELYSMNMNLCKKSFIASRKGVCVCLFIRMCVFAPDL